MEHLDATCTLFGISINNVDFNGAIDLVNSLVALPAGGMGRYIVTPNVDHVVKLRHDSEFKYVYAGAAAVFADGMPLVWASRLLGKPLKERVAGSDLFTAICELSARKGYTLFFLGGLPGVAEAAKRELTTRYPGLNVVGTYSPPFGFENDAAENKKIINLINADTPEILFIGLGCPKQEKWIYQHCDELNIKVALCTGAAFDFVAGTVKRAPMWMQRIGFEWLYRLLSEPGRLWRRYLVDDVAFLKIVTQEYVRLKCQSSDKG